MMIWLHHLINVNKVSIWTMLSMCADSLLSPTAALTLSFMHLLVWSLGVIWSQCYTECSAVKAKLRNTQSECKTSSHKDQCTSLTTHIYIFCIYCSITDLKKQNNIHCVFSKISLISAGSYFAVCKARYTQHSNVAFVV